MNRGLLLLALMAWGLTLSPPPGMAQTPAASPTPDHAAVTLLRRWARAMETRDFEEMDRLWAPDAIIFVSGHAAVGWAAYRDRHLRPRLARMAELRYTIEDVGGQAGEEVAWLAFRFRVSASIEGRRFEGPGLGTAILRRAPEGWRILHLHTSSPLPRPSPVPTAPDVGRDRSAPDLGTTRPRGPEDRGAS